VPVFSKKPAKAAINPYGNNPDRFPETFGCKGAAVETVTSHGRSVCNFRVFAGESGLCPLDVCFSEMPFLE
jgi:hypothetical protein